MDTANMTRTSDDSNSSDDLIAELARLMADEARGEPGATPAAKAPETPVPPQKTAASMPTPTTSPSDRLGASRGGEALYTPEERDGDRPTPKFSPTFKKPASRANPLRETVSDDPQLSSNREDRFAPGYTAPEFENSTPSPSFAGARTPNQTPPVDPGFDDNALGEIASFTPPADFSDTPQGQSEPAFEQSKRFDEPRVSREPDDPIGDLIAAQLHEDTSAVDHTVPFDNATQHQPPAEDDNFTVPPVFGLGTEPAQHQNEPSAKRLSDPLDDIESLIGSAVRGGIEPTHTPEPSFRRQEPQVAPAPDRQTTNDVTGAAAAAEAAILAATASMGTSHEPQPQGLSRVNRAEMPVEQPVGQPEPQLQPAFAEDTAEPQQSFFKRIVAPAAAGAILLAIGVGIYLTFGMGTPTDGEAPVLSASNEAVKADPEPGTNTTSSASDSVVFNELDGNGATTIEQLVSRDQSTEVASNEVSRVITTNDDADSGLANRRVRTVTVRPDGTIVSGDDALAATEILPVDRPNVPELPDGSEVAASEFTGNPIVEPTATATQVAATDDAAVLAASADTTTIEAPIPRPRPTNLASAAGTAIIGAAAEAVSNGTNSEAVNLIANTASQALANSTAATAATTPVATAPVATATNTNALTTTNSAPAYVQLASQRTAETAQQSLAAAQSRFGNVLVSPLEVQRVDLADRGIFFRVRMPADSIAIANTVCSDVKLNGGDCFVRTN